MGASPKAGLGAIAGNAAGIDFLSGEKRFDSELAGQDLSKLFRQVRAGLSVSSCAGEYQLPMLHSTHAQHMVGEVFQVAASSLHDYDFQAVVLI